MVLRQRTQKTAQYSLIEDEQDKQVHKVHTLDSGKLKGFRVSSVTWSNAGPVIGVAYEHTEHDDWCDHETILAIWNINRRDFDPSVPFQQLEVTSCLTITKFHPRQPGYIVAGSYTGK